MTYAAQRTQPLIALLMIALLAMGCTSDDEHGHDRPYAEPLRDVLIGSWVSNCAQYPDGPGAFVQEETYFRDGSWYLITTQYEFADCTGAFSESVTEGWFYLGRSVVTQDGIVATEIDWDFGNDACYSLIDYDGRSDTYVLGDFNDPVADCSTPFDRSRRMDFGVVYVRARH